MDSSYKVMQEISLGDIIFMLRLSERDTIILKRLFGDLNAGGLSFIVQNMRGYISRFTSSTYGMQLKYRAYAPVSAFAIDTPLRGFYGKYSNVEIVCKPGAALEAMERFIRGDSDRIPAKIKMTSQGDNFYER